MGLRVALEETSALLEENGLPSSLNNSLPFPVYYINKIQHAELQMEESFGKNWDLRRTSAFSTQKMQRDHSMSLYQDLIEEGTEFPLAHHDPAEIDRILSHLLTIRKAYLEGNAIAMITEDNISPLLM